MDAQDKIRLRNALLVAAASVALIWLVKALEFFLGHPLTAFGILPRSFPHLTGIVTAPLVHGDWGHLWSNTAPLFVSVAAIFYLYREFAWRSVLWIWALTGLWVWLGAVSAFHIGASGLVYGFVSFLFFSGILRWETRSVAISILVAFLYGGMVWGIFPTQEKVSWESHLFGAIAGVAIAFVYRKKGIQRKRYRWEDEPDTEQPGDAHAAWNYKQTLPPPPVLHEED
jgi:membrane associated rhomboid family serine protease